MKNKKAIFFSADALIALLIIFLVILIAYPVFQSQEFKSEIDKDIITSLSSLRIGEINNLYIQNLISQGIITDTNNTILEQIGDFYITNKTLAENVANEALKNLETKENIGLWAEGNLIASKNKTSIESAKAIKVSRQVISGIKQGENITGFSARAFLSGSMKSKYFYFGGYIGDGNITTKIDFVGNISSAKLEIAINKDFDLYINNNYIGNYQKSESDLKPMEYTLPIASFSSGENTIDLRGENLYIAGGFIKITYEPEIQNSETEIQNLPGVDGIVNLYDGLTIPGKLNELEVFLHINSTQSLFFNLGNKTIIQTSNPGEQNVLIESTNLSNLIDFNSLEQKTTPIRIGLENVSYIINGTSEADIFSVTDLSGSMADGCSNGNFFCCIFSEDSCTTELTCNQCNGNWQQKLSLAKEANNLLIDSLLNFSTNQIGLVGYKQQADDIDYHQLSNDTDSLKSKVDDWTAQSSTCICCGINKAKQGFIDDSSPQHQRAMIVMSDGVANVGCSEQNTGDPKLDAIKAACEAYTEENITVHTVGFGNDADENTLQAIASCGNGSYYFSEINEIAELYQQIAQDIIEGTYTEQTIEISGDLKTKIYPDSYISFNSNQSQEDYGLIITTEKQFTDKYFGTFKVPTDSEILEARAISYSGSKWTDQVKLNNFTIYDLKDYGLNYTELGDPYSIELPTNLIQENNTVEITTASSPENSSGGSPYNKVIYTIIKNVSGFSPIVSVAEGCNWTIQFEDESNITAKIPEDYLGQENCFYTENNIQYNLNDAIQTAVFNLLSELDLDENGKIDIEFTKQDLKIDLTEVTGIPFPWSTEVQIRKWI